MSLIKRLVSDTAIYGTSSILARGLNYLLTFLIAQLIPTSDFGVFVDLYAMVGFMLVVLTHGMETSYFRHVNILPKSANVFGTAFLSVAGITTLFLILTLAFLQPIANLLSYPDQTAYISVFAFIIFFDVLSAIPFARLRQLGKAKFFASLKVLNILLTIGLNIFFLIACPNLVEQGSGVLAEWVAGWYNPGNKVLYVFLANLLASTMTFSLLLPGLRDISFRLEKLVYRRMLRYALPIMVMGFAGVINEMFDRKILRFLLPGNDTENLRQVGIYGFAYKLSMIMSLFLQAYRYAVEPILFSEVKDEEQAPRSYAAIMRYYVMAASFLFLFILFNLPLANQVLFVWGNYNPDYQASLAVVPILLAANGFLGIYFNVSIWYKVTDKTMYGAYIAILGAVITIVLNLWLVPYYGYYASAWATLACYAIMTMVGLWIGQKKYPIPYDSGRILFFIGLSALFFLLHRLLLQVDWFYHSAISIALIGLYIIILKRGQT